MQAFLFYLLLTLDPHNLGNLLTRYLIMSQLVLQFFHLILFDKAVLSQIFQSLKLFFLCFGFTDTLLAF